MLTSFKNQNVYIYNEKSLSQLCHPLHSPDLKLCFQEAITALRIWVAFQSWVLFPLH